MSKSFFKRAASVRPLLFAAGLVGVFYSAWVTEGPSAAEQPKVLPAPLHDVHGGNSVQTAVFAGGCFWGTQAIFQHVEGVVATAAGYAGGAKETAVYELTESGNTNHAEAVRVDYDPTKVSYGTLLQVFFSVAHDPTQLNRQGADVGTQYRSAIFPQTPEQANIATGYIKQLNDIHAFGSPVVTQVEPEKPFYQAEDYHQDYLVSNPTQPYIAFVEQPKVDALKQLFPKLWRDRPLLTSDQRG